MSLPFHSSGGIMKICLYSNNGSHKNLELEDVYEYPPAIFWNGSFYVHSAGGYYCLIPFYTIPVEES